MNRISEQLLVGFRRLFGRFVPATPVIQEWEWYARDFQSSSGESSRLLGVEWNDPTAIGIDVPGDQVVRHLNERVFRPYLGHTSALLEIGSGGGRFSAVLLEDTDRLIATDTSPTMLRILRKRFAGEKRIEYVQLSGSGLEGVPDRSVDAVFSYDVFVHLSPWEVFSYLLEIRRVLRRGGRAILHHANTFSDLGWRRFLRDVDRSRKRERPDARFSLMTPEVMSELARRSGMQVRGTVTDVVRRDCIVLLESAREADEGGGD